MLDGNIEGTSDGNLDGTQTVTAIGSTTSFTISAAPSAAVAANNALTFISSGTACSTTVAQTTAARWRGLRPIDHDRVEPRQGPRPPWVGVLSLGHSK